jgi:hypothetical protein
MAHAHPPSHVASAAAHGHGTADDEYDVTPPGSGHEHTDANVWIIVKFGLWLAISAIVIHIGLGFLFGLFVNRSEEATAQFPLAVGQEQRLPSGARLQQFPVNEYYEFRLHEQAVLDKYGWVNKETGVVRMPISEAMRLAVERGLPARAPQTSSTPEPSGQAQPGAAPQQVPGLMPADSSAGRTMERRRQ